MRKSLALIALAALPLVACKKQGGSEVKLETEDMKTFYTVGNMFGGRLSTLNLSEKEIEALALGLKHAAAGTKPVVELDKYRPKIQSIFKSRAEKFAKKMKEDGVKFLEKFVKDEKAQKTASGLAYKVLKEGSAVKPKATDIVEVHYHGTLIDGTVFDSSVDRKKTVELPLNRVIKGWTEGIQLVGVGGKIKLVIPSDLAYGDHGAPPKIPGGSTLVFEVEVKRIVEPPKAGGKAPAKKK